MHLAQLNVGRFRYPTDDPRMAGFMDNLDLVNGLADRSPGFVWRLKDESNNATEIRPANDPFLAVNLSVWESAEALQHFVFNTLHRKFYARRELWFEAMAEQHMVLWWVERSHIPTLEEAMERLELLRREGPSEAAFGWETVMADEQIRAQRCAGAER